MSSNTPHFYDRLSRLLWRIIVFSIVLLAVYVSFGRLLSNHVDRYREPIVDRINHAIPGRLEAERIALRWESFAPTLILNEVILYGDSGAIAGTRVEFEAAELSVDILASLRLWMPSVSSLAIKGLQVEYQVDLNSETANSAPRSAQSLQFLTRVLEVLMDKTRRLDISAARLGVNREDKVYQALLDFDYWRDGSERQLKVTIGDSTGTDIQLLAQGLGNPLRPEEFNGSGFASLVMTQEPLEILSGSAPIAAQQSAGFALTAYLQAQVNDWRLGGNWSFSGLNLRNQSADAQLSGELRVDTDFKHAAARLFNLKLETQSEPLVLPDMRAYWRDGALLLNSETLDVQQLSRLFREAAKDSILAKTLEELEPQGRVLQPRMLWHQGQNKLRAHLKLDGVSIEASDKRAGGSGITGDMWLRDNKAMFQLDTPVLELALPTVYAKPLEIANATAELYASWDAEVLHLRADNIHGLAAVGDTHGKLALKLPFQQGLVAPEMELYLGVSEGNAAARNTVIPATIPENLQRWLDAAIGDATASDLGFFYRGSLLKEERDARSIGLIGRIQATELTFLPEWPALTIDSAVLIMDDEQTGVWLEQGGLPGVRASSVGAEVWLDLERQPHLSIDGSIRGQLGAALADLRESPLAIYVPQASGSWDVQGDIAGRLTIDTPLVGVVRPEVSLSLNLNDVGLTPAPGLTLRNIHGELAYSTEDGFSAETLTGNVWGQSLQARIATQVGEVQATHIEFSSALHGPSLETFMNLGIQGHLHGESTVDGILVLAPEQAALQLTSDLKGLQIDLPEPLAKPAAASLAMRFDLDLRDPALHGALLLGQAMTLDAQFAPDQTGFAVGLGRSPLPLEAGLSSLTGALPRLDLDAWRAVLPESDEASQAHYLVQDLRVERLRFMQRELDSVVLMAERQASDWFVGWQTQWLSGELSSKTQEDHWRLHLIDVDLQALADLWVDEVESSQGWSDLPELHVSLDQVREGEQVLGHGELRLSQSDEDYTLMVMNGEWRKLQADPEQPITLIWPKQGVMTSRVSGGVLVDNLGEVFEAFGYESVLKTQSGRADFDLEWPGGPEQFGFAGTDGRLKIRLKDGKFLKASAGAQGALKVITILNFADIVSRLSLTQLFESGVPFDQLAIDASADLGLINIDKMNMEGSASRFQFSGQANLLDESLDGRLIATLPVASNLPWLAALTGGLPAAAGVYVISKIFEKQVDKFSSAVYSVKGTWQEPELAFDKLFDTKLPKPKAGAEQGGSEEPAQIQTDQDVLDEPDVLGGPSAAGDQPSADQTEPSVSEQGVSPN